MANVVVISPYEVGEGSEEEAWAMWNRIDGCFRGRPGCLSTELHRATAPEARRLVHVAEWDSADDFQAAMKDPEIERLAADLHKRFSVIQGLIQSYGSRETSPNDRPRTIISRLA